MASSAAPSVAVATPTVGNNAAVTLNPNAPIWRAAGTALDVTEVNVINSGEAVITDGLMDEKCAAIQHNVTKAKRNFRIDEEPGTTGIVSGEVRSRLYYRLLCCITNDVDIATDDNLPFVIRPRSHRNSVTSGSIINHRILN
ncbi:hypothetical protein ES703_117617 [subsurface metagenome]